MAKDDTTQHRNNLRPAPAYAGRRVLVADDNSVSREMALHMLERAGCLAQAAADGIEALEAHRAAAFDLILMDCDMPRLDGYGATALLRAEEGFVRIPVLALTAHSGLEEVEKCRLAGMDGLLSKPIRPQMLHDALERWLSGKKTISVPPVASPSDELDAVCKLLGSDFAELAALYRHDSPPRIALLRQAHANSDCTLAAKIAHALGGSSASIGATSLSELCRSLEQRARSGDLKSLDGDLNTIENEYRRINIKLQTLLAQ